MATEKNTSIEQVIAYFGNTSTIYEVPDPSYEILQRWFTSYRDAKSVFDFGCNSGLALHMIKEKHPTVKEFGIDANLSAINTGLHKFKVDIICADHTYLPQIQDKSYDMVITRSVLCHIPPANIEWVTDNLKRICNKIMVCVERTNDERIGPCTWLHDYTKYGLTDTGRKVYTKNMVLYSIWTWQPT